MTGQEHYDGLIEITKIDEDIIPIFLKTLNGDLEIISSYSKEFTDIQEGFKLVYLGKAFEVQSLSIESSSIKPK